jgi:hypothetical protein
MKKFLAVNQRCSQWKYAPEFTWEEELLTSVKNTVYSFWYCNDNPIISDFQQCFVKGRSGPGSSLGTKDSNFYSKYFDSDLTATPNLVPIWDRCIVGNDLLFLAELERSVHHDTIEVNASRYSFVNKTQQIARGICTEPSINMWMQLGAGAILEERLKSFFGIDLSVQPDRSRALARHGSIFDYSFATIDLESASDSISMPMLRWLLPRSFMGVLSSLRCPNTKLPSGEELCLNMVSTMGNGFTFPLQTVIFASVVVAVYNYLNIPLTRSTKTLLGNYSVFGDDIIVTSDAARYVIRVLNLLGFVVNGDKSFVEGPFRESCGADYYLGSNVRGVYVKCLNTLQDVFVAINLLNRWSSKTQVLLPDTLSYLVSLIRNPRRYFIPPDEDDSAGIHVPREFVRENLCKGYPGRVGIHQYWAFVSKPRHMTFTETCILYGVRVKRSWLNNSGSLLAFLYGSIRGYRISLRQREVRYITKRRTTPNWGWLPPRPLEDPHESSRGRRFANACEVGLNTY